MVGQNYEAAQITNSHAVAEVSGDTRIGSFAGYLYSESDITSSYWDSEKNNNVSAVGYVRDDSANNIKGLTTSEMQGTSAKENMTGFDFEEGSNR